MTLFTAETGTDAVALSAANVPATSVTVGGTSSATFSATHAHSGTLSYRFAASATTDTVQMRLPLDVVTGKRAYVDGYVWLDGTGSVDVRIANLRSSLGTACTLVVTPAGKLRLLDGLNATLATSTASIPLSQWVRITLDALVATTSTGVATATFRPDGATTATETLVTTTGNFGTSLLIAGDVGKINAPATASSFVMWVDDWGIAAGASPGSAIATAAVTATATAGGSVAYQRPSTALAVTASTTASARPAAQSTPAAVTATFTAGGSVGTTSPGLGLTAENGSVDVALTPANVPASSVTITGTATATFSADHAYTGALSYKFAAPATVDTSNMRVALAIQTSKRCWMDGYVWIDGASPSGIIRIADFRSGLGVAGAIGITSTGTLRLFNGLFATVATSTAAVPLNQWVRITVDLTAATTTTGSASITFRAAGDSTPIETISTSTADFGVSTLTSFDLGKINATATAAPFVVYFDDWQTGTGPLPGSLASDAQALAVTATLSANRLDSTQVLATLLADGRMGFTATSAVAVGVAVQPAAYSNYSGSAQRTVTAAVSAVGTAGVPPVNQTAIVSGFEAFSPTVGGATAIISGFEAYAPGAVGGGTAVVSGFEAMGTNTALLAVLSGPAAVEPADVFALSLASSSGSPTGWTVVQLAGPDAGVAGSGVTWIGTAPFVLPDPADNPILMTFQGTVTSGAGSSSAIWTVVLYPHTMWKVLGGVLVPMKIYAAADPTPSGASVCSVQATMSASGALGTPPPNVSRSSAASAQIAVAAVGAVGGTAAFTHPGVIMTQTMLDYVQGNIAAAPYAAAWLKVTNKTNDIAGSTNINLKFSDPTWAAHPVAQVGRGSGGSPSEGDTDMYSDAMAASVQAMVWAFQGNRAAANNATRIINSWATTCTLIKYDDVVYSDGKLLAGWIGSLFARAAEIIRWTYTPTGLDPVLNVNAVKTFFTTVVYPRVLYGHNGGGANWLLSMADATIQMAVFNDDQAAFATGVTNWRSWTKSSIWQTGDVNGHAYGGGGSGGLPIAPSLSMYDSDSYSGSGYASPRLGFIGYWHDPTPTTGFWVNGLQGEIGRDPWHAAMGWAAMCNGAETAWHQGIALWTEEESRITTSMELLAGWISSVFVTGQNPPVSQSWPFSAAMGNRGASDSQRATWEISYNHYHNRRGINLPKTLAMLTNYQRPGSYNVNLHMIGENTTHRDNTA